MSKEVSNKIIFLQIQAQWGHILTQDEIQSIESQNVTQLRASLLNRFIASNSTDHGKNIYSILIVLCRYFPENPDQEIPDNHELLLSIGRRVNIFKKDSTEFMSALDREYEMRFIQSECQNKAIKLSGIFFGAVLGAFFFLLLPDIASKILLLAIILVSMMVFACLGFKIASFCTNPAPLDAEAAKLIKSIDKEIEQQEPAETGCCHGLFNLFSRAPKLHKESLEFEDYRENKYLIS
jgi:hypothetical protein